MMLCVLELLLRGREGRRTQLPVVLFDEFFQQHLIMYLEAGRMFCTA